MLQHLMMFYKYGGKQLYYFNTNDGAGEIDIDKLDNSANVENSDIVINEDEACESCVI